MNQPDLPSMDSKWSLDQLLQLYHASLHSLCSSGHSQSQQVRDDKILAPNLSSLDIMLNLLKNKISFISKYKTNKLGNSVF